MVQTLQAVLVDLWFWLCESYLVREGWGVNLAEPSEALANAHDHVRMHIRQEPGFHSRRMKCATQSTITGLSRLHISTSRRELLELAGSQRYAASTPISSQ